MISRDEYLRMPLKKRFIQLSQEDEARAEELHKNSLVIDLHTHILEEEFHANVAPIQSSQVNGVFEAVAAVDEDFPRSMDNLGRFMKVVEKHPDFMPAF